VTEGPEMLTRPEFRALNFQGGVMAGFDPVIHLLRKTLPKIDGCAGQARA
jgi:hypothetical protein